MAQLVRAPPCHGGGRGFESRLGRSGSLAQLGEHLPYKQRVTGSSPVVPTNYFVTGKEICLSTIIIILHSRRAELEKFEVIFFNGRVVQLVRTLACHARGRRFDPDPGRQFASVAQSVEQGTENPRVIGSIPIGGTINADVAHPVERHLAKVEVASSSLVIRSINSLCL